MTNEQCIDLGADMWLALAGTFSLAMEADGAIEVTEKVLVFAGFISSMSGSMLAAVGPEVAKQILDQAKKSCAGCMRQQFTVVPKCKPEWKDAPDWAMWLAMDSIGTWCWFKREPTKGLKYWIPHKIVSVGDFELVDGIHGGAIDWNKTLEQRP